MVDIQDLISKEYQAYVVNYMKYERWLKPHRIVLNLVLAYFKCGPAELQLCLRANTNFINLLGLCLFFSIGVISRVPVRHKEGFSVLIQVCKLLTHNSDRNIHSFLVPLNVSMDCDCGQETDHI